jgi:hypothetical protein
MCWPASRFHIVGDPWVEKKSYPQRGERLNIPRAMLITKPLAQMTTTIASAAFEWIAPLAIHRVGMMESSWNQIQPRSHRISRARGFLRGHRRDTLSCLRPCPLFIVTTVFVHMWRVLLHRAHLGKSGARQSVLALMR